MDLGLSDRVAFVAGASAGLGRAVAASLAREGARVAICSRNRDRIERAAAFIRDEARVDRERVLPLVCNVTEEAAIERAYADVIEAYGALHVLVTNAGGPPAGTVEDFDAEDWRGALELNLMSTINLCRHALPHLREAVRRDAHARIIMVTSVSAKQPVPTLYLSNTARAGVQGFAKSLAEELGPEGITVNTVLPGYTRTERLEELADALEARTGQSPSETEKQWATSTALKRLGDPAEFAAAVTFLAGQTSSYITGVALPIDGGRVKHLL